MLLTYIRTIILYLVLIFVVRLMGKRQIGEMEPMEFVVTMLVANLAAIPMQDGSIPLFSGLVPILTILGMELVLSTLSFCSIRIRKVLCSSPVILIDNGKVLQDNLKKTRINIDELRGHLRDKNVLDLSTVQYAILETNGSISVFPYPKNAPASAKDAGVQASAQYMPVAVVSDGKVLSANLTAAGKNRVWLSSTLNRYHANVENTWLLTVDGADKVVYIPKEAAK